MCQFEEIPSPGRGLRAPALRKLAACKTLVIWTEYYSPSWSSPQKRGGQRSTRPWFALVYVSSRSAARFVVEKRHSFTPGTTSRNCEGQPFLASVSFEIMHQLGECHHYAPAGITRSDARPWRRSAAFVVASACAVPRGAEEAARAASTAPMWGFTCTDVLNTSSAFVALRRGLVAVFGGACAPSVSDSQSHNQGVFVALGDVDGPDVEPTSGSHHATR